ncbi:uveal autoantigen with coiled-coil domains and ankyrin repeats-like [Uloborus diversus]|uniref:uveal autoantigen with coiled-coil domains and ankyrin repeats-like n=1 Tax=Uloborus diversus TaxID=327109 RepID=UPI00240A909D|nr:uveal autoantigen with coiled-coil domains and ankyrin repeats-like [Uloborus diversus]
MARKNERKDFNEECSACDFEKLRVMENNPTIRELREKIEQLSIRLTECKTENQMLKKDLNLAKKMVLREVGTHDLELPILLKRGTEAGWKGRMENVLLLKQKLQELRNYLREIEGNAPEPKVTPSEEFAKRQIPYDRKLFWRMELERRLARENAEKDMNPLIQECQELRKTLDKEKTRYRELNDEVKLLKAELQSLVEKNQEDIGIVKSFQTLENQLEESLAQRAELRKDLDGSRTRNQRLAEEKKSLEEELRQLQQKAANNNNLIDSLTHKHIQEAIECEKKNVQQNIDGYADEMNTLQSNYESDVKIIDHLQYIVFERISLVRDLQKDTDESLMVYINEKKETGEKSPPSESEEPAETDNNSDEPGSDNALELNEQKADDDQDSEKAIQSAKQTKLLQLKIDCAKYKALLDAAQKESERLNYINSLQDSRMNVIAVQVVEAGKLAMQKNAEIKELLDKLNKLERSYSAKKKTRKVTLPTKNRFEDLKIKMEAQKEENEFLRNFLNSVVCDKANDLDMYKDFVAETKQHFLKVLHELKDLQTELSSDSG